MRMSRVLTVVAILALAVGVAGWAQELVRLPVQGTYWDPGIGEQIKYAGELRIAWSGGTSYEFLVADAMCEHGKTFVLYGVSSQPIAGWRSDTEMLQDIRSLHMIGVGHAPGFSGPAEVGLVAATAGTAVISAR